MILTEAEWQIIALSIKVGFWSCMLNLVPAFSIAWVLSRKKFWGRFIVEALVYLPLILPPVVVGYGLLWVFGNFGLLGEWLNLWFGWDFVFSWYGAVLSSAIMAFPLMVRSFRLSIDHMGFAWDQTAQILGAGRLRILLTIVLPLILPGICAGVFLGFARSLGEFGATITFVANIANQTQTLPLAIYSLMQQPGGETLAWRLCLFSLAIAFIALTASEYLIRRWHKQYFL
ncbi:MAG: molybdate ABC transporter permease subunit [Rhodospirillaceae bacterium]|nr:molybdate ABC transporter permease subunit [Rhodospirillaceae bacterium]